MTKSVTWQNFQKHYLDLQELGMAIDTSRMNVPDKLPNELEMLFRRCFSTNAGARRRLYSKS